MKKRVATPFVTNVLRVALNFQEEKIAARIVADYKPKLDERMVDRAIKTNQLYFLYSIYAFNKNYECLVDYTGEENESSETEDEDDTTKGMPDEDEPTIAELEAIKRRRSVKYKTYTFEWLIERVIEVEGSEEAAEAKLR